MEKISYEKFVKLVNSFDEFNEKLLFALYEKYGKEIINTYFDKMSSDLQEDDFLIFAKKYSAYFDNIYDGSLKNESGVTDLINHTFYSLGTDNTSIMNQNEEIYYGNILNEAKALSICENNDNLYPKVNIAKILKSIYKPKALTSFNKIPPYIAITNAAINCPANLELLKEIKSLPYKLGDDNILKGELQYIKTMLKLINKPSYEEFCKIFNEFNFNNIDISDNISYELTLLKKYIIAKNNFFKRNIRLVYSISSHFNNVSKMQLNDIIQEGNFGLIKAINKFDISKGNRFSTYATYWIKQFILKSLNYNTDLIRKPYQINSKKSIYNKFITEYYIKYKCMPSVEIISKELGISKNDIYDFENNYASCTSLEIPINNEDGFLSEVVPDKDATVEEDIMNKELSLMVNSAMNKYLTDREKEVLMLRFGLNEDRKEYTLEEIGQKYGITRERIRQIEIKARKKLRFNDKNTGLKDFLR